MPRWTALFALLAVPAILPAQTILEDFENSNLDAATLFRTPRFSGSTSNLLEDTPDAARVIQRPRPESNLPGAGLRLFEVHWQYRFDRPDRWLRLTTFNTTNRPNPRVDINQKLRLDLFATSPVRIALGLREVTGTGPIGSNGGTSGQIEWVANSGVRTDNVVARPGGLLVPAGQWLTIEFDLPNIPRNTPAPGQIAAFTGNGRLDSPAAYVLEHLALSAEGDHYGVQLFIDRVYQTP